MRLAAGALAASLVLSPLAAGCAQRVGAPATDRTSAARGDVLQGTYKCGPDEQTMEDTLAFSVDGTVTITQPGRDPGEAAYSLDGTRGDIEGDAFSVEGDRLLFDDGFVCEKEA